MSNSSKCYSILKKRPKPYLLLLTIFLTCLVSNAQTILTGTVTDEKTNNPLIGVSVTVKALSKGATTDNNGKFTLKLPDGNHSVAFSFVGYESVTRGVNANGSAINLTILLQEAVSELKEVVVNGRTAVQEKKEQPFHVSVINTKPFQIQSSPITALVGQMSGVRIREDGGMGSNVSIMLNGIGGKGVRIFFDDIPADLLGNGMSINNVPVNMIDHIEVYKGMVPSKFGSDALGGMLNLVTRDTKKDYLDFTTGLGSFGTYQVSINTRKYFGENKKAYLGLNGFYNHSDNNYWMDDVDIITDELGNVKKGRVRRFHDAYTSYFGKVTFGLRRVQWADDVQLNFASAYTYKEWQHGRTPSPPWGCPYSEQTDINTEFRWKKNRMLNERLDASFIAGANHTNSYFLDTASSTYYWGSENGMLQYIPKVVVGESGVYINGRSPQILAANYFVRAFASYQLVQEKQIINLTWFTIGKNISGHDDRGVATFGEDPLENPQKLFKNYLGLSLESRFLNSKLINIMAVKSFYGNSTVNVHGVRYEYEGSIDNEYNNYGYGNAIKYQFLSGLAATLNYEYSMRIPDPDELFGDFITTFPNAELKPEKSHNIDLGIRIQSKKQKIMATINGFYRKTTDLIFLNSITTFKSTYMNLLSTNTLGAEGDVKVKPTKSLELFANATWQDIRLAKTDPNGKVSERYINARIPNTPWLFANVGINYTVPKKIIKKGKLNFFYTGNYVHEFFLGWAVDGVEDTKNTIPSQTVHNAGVSYLFFKDRISLSVECNNFTNRKVYDNYMVQKPGRSVYLKLRISI